LKHAAVDQDFGPLGDEQELRSGDGVCSAEEVNFHMRILPPRGGERRPDLRSDGRQSGAPRRSVAMGWPDTHAAEVWLATAG
jgi:hypothetical protein